MRSKLSISSRIVTASECKAVGRRRAVGSCWINEKLLQDLFGFTAVLSVHFYETMLYAFQTVPHFGCSICRKIAVYARAHKNLWLSALSMAAGREEVRGFGAAPRELIYRAISICCIVPVFPFSYRNIPVCLTTAFVLLSASELSENRVLTFPR